MPPKLPFNDATSKISTDVIAVGDKVSAIIPKINAFSSLHEEENFALKMSSIELNGLLLISYAQSGIYFERDDCRGCDLIIPINGQNHTVIDGVKYEFNAGESAFLSSHERRKSTLRQSGLNLRLNAKRLDSTRASMLGAEFSKALSPEIKTPSLQVGKISFSKLFLSLCQKIDEVEGSEKIARQLGLDDSFYRLSVGLLQPDLFLMDETHKGVRPNVRKEVRQLCEFLRANLTEPTSVTQMEQISGLSIRVLQYSFQKAFGLRPREWLRKQRLIAARSVLTTSVEKVRLTSLAYDFCFASPSDFSRLYCLEFGETPSETIKRTRRRFSASMQSAK